MKRLFLAALALGLAACSKSSPTGTSTGSVTPVQLPDNHPAVTPLPDPEMNGGHAGRAPRRISPRRKPRCEKPPSARW